MIRRSVIPIGLAVLALAWSAMAPECRAWEEPPHAAPVAVEAAPGVEAVAAESGHDGGHGTEGEAKTNPLKGEMGLAIWTVFVFLGVLFILGKYAWGPLMKALHDREEHLEHCLLETEQARNQSEALLAEHRRLMAQAADESRAILEKARQAAQGTAEEIVKAAQAEADAAKVRAQQDIATARDQALSEIWSKTADLAVSVAGRVLSRDIGEDDHRRLLDTAIQELPQTAVSSNGAGSRSV
jgi:F-type H+-transporting ATPase subunit b